MNKSINLTIANRQIISRLLNDLSKSDVDIARKVRELRRCFQLKDANEQAQIIADKRGEAIEEVKKHNIKQEALAEKDPKYIKKTIDIPPPIGWDDLAADESKFYIDDIYITWLQTQLKDRNWHKIHAVTEMGASQEIDVVAPLDLLCAVADLDDALRKSEEANDLSKDKDASD